MPPRSAARRRSPRASCIGWKRSRARSAGKPRKRRGAKYVDFARRARPARQGQAVAQPAPKPPREARPTKLSVTAIEDWLRDPYTIYAKHILKLAPLDPVDMPLSAADRGSAIHDALGEFTKTYRQWRCPTIPRARCARIGEKHFAPLMDRPEARALWWPRFQRIARWFADWETARRGDVARYRRRDPRRDRDSARRCAHLHAVRARRPHRAPQRRPLRHPRLQDRQPPTGKQVRIGLSPQLTLEAAILREGGFAESGGRVGQRTRLCAAERRRSAGRAQAVELEIKQRDTPQSPDDAADDARGKLEVAGPRLRGRGEPYRSLVLPMWKNRYGDYDHLARVKEWSAAGGMAIEECVKAPRTIPARRPRRAGARIRSRGVRLRVGQCRLRQDPCAGAARDPAAA